MRNDNVRAQETREVKPELDRRATDSSGSRDARTAAAQTLRACQSEPKRQELRTRQASCTLAYAIPKTEVYAVVPQRILPLASVTPITARHPPA
jgi:hypothetical protein